MSWQHLTDTAQWNSILEASIEQAQVVFKHSTRCSISAMALNRFENTDLFKKEAYPCWFLDLIQYRNISDQIAIDTQVQHESPQCIVLHHGKVVYEASHGLIDGHTILEKLNSNI
ncbi:MAG: bacillithiol system redox-active protein YtxJ [Flavobacteriales bacterium]